MKDFHNEHVKCKNRGIKSIIFGLVVVATGVALLMKNAGLIDPLTADVIFSWQMLLLAIGFVNIWGKEFLFGVILMLVGGFFLATDFYGLPYTFGNVFWPALIIIIGISIIFGSRMFHIKKKQWTKSESFEEYFEDVAVFGGSEKTLHCPNLKNGKIVAVFGGSKLNLNDCVPSTEGSQIDISCVFGGTSLIVPSDWNVKFEVFNIFGGFADQRKSGQVDITKTIIIKGVCIFGGGDLKSF